jgi:serine/threonine-protein kinase RsbW
VTVRDAVTFSLACDLGELERLSSLVDEFGERNGVTGKPLFDVKLALDEVVTNVICYAAASQAIVVRLTRAGAELVIEVEDDGRPFDPLRVAAPDLGAPLDDRPVGGLGIHFVRTVIDELAYRRRGDRNVLTMKKRL